MYVQTHTICAHTRKMSVGGGDETHKCVYSSSCGRASLLDSNSGISVTLSQSEIVFTGLSPRRSHTTNTAAHECHNTHAALLVYNKQQDK